MDDYRDQSRSGDRLRSVGAALLTAVAITATVVVLHGPAADLGLAAGDTFQWLQHAHLATHQPNQLITDLDSFYRPSTTWSLMMDRAIWGGFNTRGYRVSSLALHVLAAFALVLAGRRLGLGRVAAAVVGLVWVTSGFTDESAFIVAQRGQPLLLLSWLAVIVGWPRAGESWSRMRVAIVLAGLAAAAATKESWVVTPGLIVALEIDRGSSLRSAMRPVLMVGAGVAVYMILYFLAFPAGDKSYFELGSHVAAKIPTQLAGFLYLEEPMPFALELSWQGMLALVAVVAVVGACVKWRVAGTWTAVALFLLPTLPTLLVPYMPQRYLAIPYVGFLLLAALWIGSAAERMPRWRLAIRGSAIAVAVMVVFAGAVIVRSDLDDYRRMAAAHDVLLGEAAKVADVVAGGDTVIVVREERSQPLLEILREPRGFAKLPYTRHGDPYGLVDAGALFEWVIAEEGVRVEPVIEGVAGVEGPVLVHIDGGFVDAGRVADLGAEAERWRTEGRRVRLVRAVSLTPPKD